MHKMTNQIQCGDLAMALEEGLAAIDIELGAASDLVVTYRADSPTLSDLKKAFSAGEETFQHALSARDLHERFPFTEKEIPYLLKAWDEGWAEADFARKEIDVRREEQEWRSERDALIDASAGAEQAQPYIPECEPGFRH